jgi:hypothetical protein
VPGKINFPQTQTISQLSTFNKRKASDDNKQKNSTHNRYASHGNTNSLTPFLESATYDLNVGAVT